MCLNYRNPTTLAFQGDHIRIEKNHQDSPGGFLPSKAMRERRWPGSVHIPGGEWRAPPPLPSPRVTPLRVRPTRRGHRRRRRMRGGVGGPRLHVSRGLHSHREVFKDRSGGVVSCLMCNKAARTTYMGRRPCFPVFILRSGAPCSSLSARFPCVCAGLV